MAEADKAAQGHVPSPAPKRLTEVPRALAEQPTAKPSRAAHTVISVRDLHMSYGSFEAVCGIDLDVTAGEVFAFLGPNGAGKTTTVEILEGYRHRSSGEVSVLGVDPDRGDGAWRARIGVVLQESEPEAELSVQECVSLYAGYYPAPRPVAETIGLVGLTDHATVRCSQLSGGQRRRLDVALALVGDPELIFLDEPTTGFDPSARRQAWEVIAGLRSLGKTIFLTTHYMEEAEYLADRIAVIAAGRIVAEGTPATLGGRDAESATIRFTLPASTTVSDLPAELTAAVASRTDGLVELAAANPLPLLGALATWAALRGVELPDLAVFRPTLEDVYLRLTKQP
jgi:ABC-2 type transport system ATP-binding protein